MTLADPLLPVALLASGAWLAAENVDRSVADIALMGRGWPVDFTFAPAALPFLAY